MLEEDQLRRKDVGYDDGEVHDTGLTNEPETGSGA